MPSYAPHSRLEVISVSARDTFLLAVRPPKPVLKLPVATLSEAVPLKSGLIRRSDIMLTAELAAVALSAESSDRSA
jgi:hypothetical protein